MRRLKDKFKNITLVQPLYRKVFPKNVTAINIDSVYKLDGHEFEVKKTIDLATKKSVNTKLTKQNHIYNNLPGVCEDDRRVKVKENVIRVINNKNPMISYVSGDYWIGKEVIKQQNITMPGTVKETWLRVYPAPKLQNETTCSVIFRCMMCQLGIATFLTLWTCCWVFVIQSFEGPYESKVSLEFETEQNQLVIDLATELRQITPISPKWRSAIERRMQDERQLTIAAIGRGARVRPGQFWDMPGTLLFSIYVMTALGFGAPVPQTIWGRTSALLYAFLAVPLHIYLMMNASTFLVSHVNHWGSGRETQRPYSDENKESPNYSRNSELNKHSNLGVSKKLKSIMSVIGACHCVPFAALVYYICGAIVFGVMRERPAVDVVMFPLEFTTTGGLEYVSSHVRVFYGFYIEGAMVLLSCALATLRHRSHKKISAIAEKYRLFDSNEHNISQ